MFEQKDLSIVTISDDIYYALKTERKLTDGIIYNVSSDFVNAHNDRVINVKDPEVSSDATNKHYVDVELTKRDETLTDIDDTLTDINSNIAHLAKVSVDTTTKLDVLSTRYDSALSTVEVCHHKDDDDCEKLSVE